MIILNKKRLVIIVGILCMAIFAFTFQVADYNNTVQTVSLPVSNKVIVLDARTSVNQMNGAESNNRYYRSGNKFKNCA